MSDPLRRRERATYEDLIEVPDHLVAEILDGDLYATPRPAPPHARAASVLGADILAPFDREGGCAGEPAAHIAVMEDEIVRRRGWLSRQEFLDLLRATNLIPEPNSPPLFP